MKASPSHNHVIRQWTTTIGTQVRADRTALAPQLGEVLRRLRSDDERDHRAALSALKGLASQRDPRARRFIQSATIAVEQSFELRAKRLQAAEHRKQTVRWHYPDNQSHAEMVAHHTRTMERYEGEAAAKLEQARGFVTSALVTSS